MSDDKKGSLERVLDQLTDPLDWVAAAAGAAGGAVVTGFAHGLDMGHSIPAGALGAIAAKKAAFASFQRPRLRKRADAMMDFLRAAAAQPDNSSYAERLD